MSEPPTAARVRQYCDEELPAPEAGQFERELAADPALAGRVEFERRLRDSVGRVMQDDCPRPSADLADRIRARLAEAEPAADANRQGALAGALAAFLRGPQRASIFAVAATLVLVGGAVLVGIFGTPIDGWRPRPVNLVAEALPFVSGEHDRCAGSVEAREAKAPFRRPEEAALQLSDRLGIRVLAVSLTNRLEREGWSFVGGGRCGVPVDDPSCHLIYRRLDPDAGPVLLSLFMIPDRGNYRVTQDGADVAIRPGRWIEWRELSRPVRVYSDGELIYMMVMCHPQGVVGATEALESIGTQR